MTLAFDQHSLDYQPMSALLVRILLGALTILVSMLLKDLLTSGIALVVPEDLLKKFAFTALITVIFLFVTVIVAWNFQTSSNVI